MKTLIVPGLFLLLLASTPTALPAEELSAKDKAFVETAARGGQMEVDLGRLAEKRGTHADVVAFGAMMVKDHSNTNAELAAFARKNEVTLPATLSKAQTETVREISQLSGADFDKRYVREMEKDHKATIAEFEQAAKGADNLELRALAEKTLPALKMHLERIQEIARSL